MYFVTYYGRKRNNVASKDNGGGGIITNLRPEGASEGAITIITLRVLTLKGAITFGPGLQLFLCDPFKGELEKQMLQLSSLSLGFLSSALQ